MGDAPHYVVHTEASGAFLQVVCACGALLTSGGLESVSSMLAIHIRGAGP